MLRWRLTSAAVILVALLLLLWLDFRHHGGRPGIWLAPILLATALLATGECLDLLRHGGHRPSSWSAYLGTTMVVAGACAPIFWIQYPAACPLGKLGWPLAALALTVMLAFVAELRRYEAPGDSVVGVALSVLIVAYVGLLSGFLSALRGFQDNAWGMAALISLLLIVKVSDAGAYACGRLLGRHKMAPVLSPGKTIEGAVGGVLCACAASYLYFRFVVPPLVGLPASVTPWWGAIAYALILATAGMVGDLAESLWKRDMGCKDSSNWLPGLGGVLDILDSVLAAAAPAFLCWSVGLIGPG